ncbi:MAG: aldo/keto reductase [Nitrososphaerales archaeon]|jgi:diketogulonate reductase-like aldo/keto reductase
MESRELGKTGEKIPVVGMGTWAIGNSSGDQRREEIKALQRGIELGLRFIDTAEVYGHGRSESLVGDAIRDRRDDVFLATKVAPENFAYDDVIKSCETSLQRLGVKFVDLYQLHWPNPRVRIQETMRAMQELVSTGKTRYVGVSNFSVEQTMQAQESLPRSELVSNQVRYSITSRSVESDLIPFCDRERITVIAYSPLDTGNIPASRIPRDMLAKYEMTPAQLMLNWVTYRDPVVAIPKAGKAAHVEENARSVDMRLSQSDYNELSRRFE